MTGAEKLCANCRRCSRPRCGNWRGRLLASRIVPGALAQQPRQSPAFAALDESRLSRSGTPLADAITRPVIRMNQTALQFGAIATPLGFNQRVDNSDDSPMMKGQTHG